MSCPASTPHLVHVEASQAAGLVELPALLCLHLSALAAAARLHCCPSSAVAAQGAGSGCSGIQVLCQHSEAARCPGSTLQTKGHERISHQTMMHDLCCASKRMQQPPMQEAAALIVS